MNENCRLRAFAFVALLFAINDWDENPDSRSEMGDTPSQVHVLTDLNFNGGGIAVSTRALSGSEEAADLAECYELDIELRVSRGWHGAKSFANHAANENAWEMLA